MCTVALAVAGASAAVGVASAVSQSRAAARSANTNAALAEEQAADRMKKAEFDAAESARESNRAAGAREARIGDAGISADSFSDIRADDAAEADLEQRAIRYNAKVEAKYLRAQATMQRTQAQDSKRAGVFNAISSVVNAAGSVTGSRGGSGWSGSSSGGGVTIQSLYSGSPVKG